MTDAMSRLQAPVRYKVSTSPTRAGNYAGPFQIINFSANAATVWVANNAGLQAGQGTPIYPGTSLTWEKSGELWVVGENNNDEIIISYDVSNWNPNPAAVAAAVLNSGILLIDQPENIYTVFLTGPGSGTGVDISRYQSVNISIVLLAASGVGTDVINVLFGDGGVTTYRVPLAFNTVGHIWTATMPCYGSVIQMNITYGSQFGIFVAGSHRNVATARQRVDTQTPPQSNVDLAYESFQGAGNGPNTFKTTYTLALPPWHGELELDVNVNAPKAPGGNSEVRWAKFNVASGLLNSVRRKKIEPIQGTLYSVQDRICVNGDALYLQIVNDGPDVTYNWGNSSYRITPSQGALFT